jgi:hypothetical protein
MTDEKEPISFEHLGGKIIHVPDPHGKSADLSPAYGKTGRLVCKAEPDAPEEKDGDADTD